MKTFLSGQIVLLAFLLLGFRNAGFANPSSSCGAVFSDLTKTSSRNQIIETAIRPELSELLFQLKSEGKLVYKGDHKFEPGWEYLASNEYDWQKTPFDHKEADVLVAFGTNSSWEIAVDKNVKSLYIADWSPYPILASAYLISPLIKISKTPKEFIILLSGRIPTKELLGKSLDDLLYDSRLYAAKESSDKLHPTKEFLNFLEQQESISDTDLKFLTSYFYSLMNSSKGRTSVGPFENLRYASYAKILNFLDQRYSPTVVKAILENSTVNVTLEEASVFSSQKNFEKLKALFVKDNVYYAITSITDTNFYSKVQSLEKNKGHTKYSLSMTNIFDCGDYNGLAYKDMQNLLTSAMNIFDPDVKNPFVVFRTTGTMPPHGFLRYDLTNPSQVKEIPWQPNAPSASAVGF